MDCSRNLVVVLALAALALAPTGTRATQPPDALPPAGLTAASASDALFLREAHALHIRLAAAARLALERSRDVRVRQFARRLLRDHDVAHAQLEASARGALRGQGLRHDARAEKAFDLAGLRGVAFDRQFVAAAGVEAHREALLLFEQQARAGRDPKLVRFASGMLARLERQLAAAQALQAQFELRRRNFPATPAEPPAPPQRS